MAVRRSAITRRLPVALNDHELEVRTWIQMVRTFSQMQRLLENSLSEHGVSLPQFDVLATLLAGEGITQQELAARLLVTKGNVCGLIDRVESAGWVERRPDAHDRRANRLYLTDAGRDLLAKVAPGHLSSLKTAMSRLTPSQIQSLFQLLDQLEEGCSSV